MKLLSFSLIANSPDARYRWSVAVRTVTAVVGGWLNTVLISLALTVLLIEGGMARRESIMAAAMVGLCYYAVVVMAAFHARSTTQVWSYLLVASMLAGMFCLLFWPLGT